jgi:hypothetical protein
VSRWIIAATEPDVTMNLSGAVVCGGGRNAGSAFSVQALRQDGQRQKLG